MKHPPAVALPGRSRPSPFDSCRVRCCGTPRCEPSGRAGRRQFREKPAPRGRRTASRRRRSAAGHAATAWHASSIRCAFAASSSSTSSAGISVSHSISVGLGPKRSIDSRYKSHTGGATRVPCGLGVRWRRKAGPEPDLDQRALAQLPAIDSQLDQPEWRPHAAHDFPSRERIDLDVSALHLILRRRRPAVPHRARGGPHGKARLIRLRLRLPDRVRRNASQVLGGGAKKQRRLPSARLQRQYAPSRLGCASLNGTSSLSYSLRI